MSYNFIKRVSKKRRKFILLEEIVHKLKNLGISKELDFINDQQLDVKSLQEWLPWELADGPSRELTTEQLETWSAIFMFSLNSLHEYQMAHVYIVNTIEVNHLLNPNIEFDQSGKYKFLNNSGNGKEEDFLELYTAEGLEVEIEKMSIYTPGVCVVILQILLEKFLKNSVNLVKEHSLGNSNSNIQTTARSEIDTALSFLEASIGLNYQKNLGLKGLIYKLRTARNAFAHGSWDNLGMTLNEIQVFDLLNEIRNLCLLVIKKMVNSELSAVKLND